MNHTFQLCTNILDNLKWLRNHNELCDIILLTKEQKLFAHSCILASHSPVLAAILQARLASENDWSILKPLIISLDEERLFESTDQVGSQSFGSILEIIVAFMYGEKISIEDSRLSELINFSKILGLSQHFQDPQFQKSNLILKHRNKRKPNLSQKISNFTNESHSSPVFINANEGSDCHRDNDDSKSETTLDKDLSNDQFNDASKEIDSDLPLKKICEHVDLEVHESKLNSFSSDDQNNLLKSSVINDAETETWFRNELLNPVEVKILHDRNNFDSIDESIDNKIKKTFSEIYVNGKISDHGRKPNRLAISCQICSASFHRANDLVQHVKGENHFSQVCPLCFLQFDEYNEQELHFLQHDHPLPFFCFCCDLRFRSRAGLSMHAPKHSSTKPYVCKECGRGFKWRHAAQAHAITHRSHCHLLCDICGFSSKYMSTFKSHLKRHYDQFFPCPHPGCNFKSFRKTHLTDHIATHTKLRPHQCEVCGHSFSQAKNLRRHMRLHAPDSTLLKCAPHSKEDCPFGTTRPDKLRSHLVKKHNIIPCGRSSLDSCVTFKEDDYQSADDVLPEKDLETNENMEAVSTLKNVIFEDQSAEKEMFFEDILSSKSIIPSTTSTDENADTLYGKQNDMCTSADINVSVINEEENTLISADSYESFFISSAIESQKSVNDSDEKTNHIQSSLVLMEGIEVNCFPASNCTTVQEGSTLQSSIASDSSNNLNTFHITSSSSCQKEEGYEFLISYLPHIHENSLVTNQSPTMDGILNGRSHVKLEGGVHSLHDNQYIELPAPINSIIETDEQCSTNSDSKSQSLTVISNTFCEYGIPSSLNSSKQLDDNSVIPVSNYSISSLGSDFDSIR